MRRAWAAPVGCARPTLATKSTVGKGLSIVLRFLCHKRRCSFENRPKFARYFPVRNRQKKCREPRASVGEEGTFPSRGGGACSRSVLAARSAPLPKPPGVSVQAPIEWLLGRGGMPRRVPRRRYWGAGLAVCAKSLRIPPTLPLRAGGAPNTRWSILVWGLPRAAAPQSMPQRRPVRNVHGATGASEPP